MSKKTKDTNLKILLLTGKSAEKIVRDIAPPAADVIVLPIDVAAFITEELIKENLSKKEVENFDLVMVPGLVLGDLSSLSDDFGIPFVKGPRYASDIKMTLSEIDPLELSAKIPADKFLKEKKFSKSKRLLQEGFSTKIDSSKGEYTIGFESKFPVGTTRPPLIMAEIVDATKMTDAQFLARAKYYLEYGAEILDIGAVASAPDPQKVAHIIKTLQSLKKDYKFAVSIDTLNVEEISSAIKANVEMILSIDHGNIEHLIDIIPKEVAVVYIPTDISKGILPKNTKVRTNSLLRLKKQLLDSGINKIAADPIIEMPIFPGFTKSLEYYINYRQADPITPMMTCVGNVTEFIEADPIGINALFGCVAVELGIQFLLMTDVSAKCRGGIKEIVKARNMAFVAMKNYAPPKGQGYSLLMAKSRTVTEIDLETMSGTEIVELVEEKDSYLYTMDYTPDPKGSFTIWIDYHEQKIYATHLEYKTNKPTVVLSAAKARTIFEEILRRELITKMDHAYYLGRELERAEVCLYLGKTYIQNVQVFKEADAIKRIK